MPAEMLEKYTQFIIFALIGAVNTLVHGSILIVAVEFFSSPVVLAHLVAFCAANIFSYAMNSKLTFRVSLSISRYLKFFTASTLALGLTLLLSGVMDYFEFHYLFGFFIVIVLVPFFTFLVLKTWAFAGR